MSTINPARLDTGAVHLRDSTVLDQLLNGLTSLDEKKNLPAVRVDTSTELQLAQQVLDAPLSIGRHRVEQTSAQKIDPRNILKGVGLSATLAVAFTFFYNVLEVATK